jgi:hypothetical protein
MLPCRIIRIVAFVLAVIAGTVFVLGYNFISDRNVRPEESTLDW